MPPGKQQECKYLGTLWCPKGTATHHSPAKAFTMKTQILKEKRSELFRSVSKSIKLRFKTRYFKKHKDYGGGGTLFIPCFQNKRKPEDLI